MQIFIWLIGLFVGCLLYKMDCFYFGPLNNFYNTVILVRSVIKVLNRNFLFIEKVQASLDLILSRALARDKIYNFFETFVYFNGVFYRSNKLCAEVKKKKIILKISKIFWRKSGNQLKHYSTRSIMYRSFNFLARWLLYYEIHVEVSKNDTIVS